MDINSRDMAVPAPSGKGKCLAAGTATDIKNPRIWRGGGDIEHPVRAGIASRSLAVKPFKEREYKRCIYMLLYP